MSSAVECASAVEAAATADGHSTLIAATDVAVNGCTPITIARSRTIGGPIAVTRAAIVAAIPGASTDEDAAREVARAVVTVWSASVRIVAIVTIGTNRCWTNSGVNRADTNTHANLCVCAGCGQEQNSEQCDIF
jgi:hypothetical protein